MVMGAASMVALIHSGQVAASSWSTASSEDSDDSLFSLVLPAAPITTDEYDAFTGCTWSGRCSVSLIDVWFNDDPVLLKKTNCYLKHESSYNFAKKYTL